MFSHTMTKVIRAHQPAMFKIDLSCLIPMGDCSPLFAIDNMRVTAYKQGTAEEVPVKFTVLNDNKKRVLTNDPCKLSSKWQIDINSGSYVKIAGTSTVPFKRALSVYDEENKQGLVNVLAFMMSNSLWTSDRARGAFDVLLGSSQGEFEFVCELCSEIGVACVTKGTSGRPLFFSFPQCAEDGYVCIPSQQPCATDKDYEALRNLLALVRSASLDNLGILQRVTQELTNNRSCQDLDRSSFPPTHRGNIVIPYAVMKYVTSLYQTMSEYADNFAIVEDNTHHIKVVVESPSENISEITGCITLTLIYGPSLLEIYSNLIRGMQHEEEEEQINSLANIAQLSTDVLIRRTRLDFMLGNPMFPKDWCIFYYG